MAFASTRARSAAVLRRAQTRLVPSASSGPAPKPAGNDPRRSYSHIDKSPAIEPSPERPWSSSTISSLSIASNISALNLNPHSSSDSSRPSVMLDRLDPRMAGRKEKEDKRVSQKPSQEAEGSKAEQKPPSHLLASTDRLLSHLQALSRPTTASPPLPSALPPPPPPPPSPVFSSSTLLAPPPRPPRSPSPHQHESPSPTPPSLPRHLVASFPQPTRALLPTPTKSPRNPTPPPALPSSLGSPHRTPSEQRDSILQGAVPEPSLGTETRRSFKFGRMSKGESTPETLKKKMRKRSDPKETPLLTRQLPLTEKDSSRPEKTTWTSSGVVKRLENYLASSSPFEDTLRVFVPLFERHLEIMNDIRLELQARRVGVVPKSRQSAKKELDSDRTFSDEVSMKRVRETFVPPQPPLAPPKTKVSSPPKDLPLSFARAKTSVDFELALDAVRRSGSWMDSANQFVDASIRLSLVPRAIRALENPSIQQHPLEDVETRQNTLQRFLRSLVPAVTLDSATSPLPSPPSSNSLPTSTVDEPPSLPYTVADLNSLQALIQRHLLPPDPLILAISLGAYHRLGSSGVDGIRTISLRILQASSQSSSHTTQPSPLTTSHNRESGRRVLDELDAVRPFISPEVSAAFDTYFPSPSKKHRKRLVSLLTRLLPKDSPVARSLPPDFNSRTSIPSLLPRSPKLLESYLRPALIACPSDWLVLLFSLYLRWSVGGGASSKEFQAGLVALGETEGEEPRWSIGATTPLEEMARLALGEMWKDLGEGKRGLWDEVLGLKDGKSQEAVGSVEEG